MTEPRKISTTAAAVKTIADAADHAAQVLVATAASAAEAAAKAAEAAAKVIADATKEATQVITTATAAASKVVVHNAEDTVRQGNSDHDAIVGMGVKLDFLIKEVKDLKDGTAERIKVLECTKLDIKDSYPTLYKKDIDTNIDNLDKRMGKAETSIVKAVTIGAVIMFIFNVAIILILKFVK